MFAQYHHVVELAEEVGKLSKNMETITPLLQRILDQMKEQQLQIEYLEGRIELLEK